MSAPWPVNKGAFKSTGQSDTPLHHGEQSNKISKTYQKTLV